MSYCIKCGQKNEPTTKFCVRCGNQLKPKPVVADGYQPGTPADTSDSLQPAQTVAQPSFDFGLWFGKNKQYVFGLGGLLIIMWAINYFFLKPHPDKDGKALAISECNCEEKRSNNFADKQKEFLKNFDDYRFENVYAARQKLDSFNNIILEEYNTCMQQAALLRNQQITKYINDPVSQASYNEQYYAQRQLCVIKNDALTRLSQDIGDKFSNFKAYNPLTATPAPVVPAEPLPADTTTAPVTEQPQAADGAITDDFLRNKITTLYKLENNIGSSPQDLDNLMAFYRFPLERYYDAKNVDQNRLLKIYGDSYFKSLSSHLVKDFENKMTISRQTDGSVKIIVGCTFEFSTMQSPGEKRSRNVFNVYVLTKDGQIKSVYQLL